jgi:hypothetical protein
MNVGFTGTRKGMTEKQKDALEQIFEQDFNKGLDEFHHGDCEGADEYAHEMAGFYFAKRVVHPPIDTRYRAYTIGEEHAYYLPKEYGYRKPKDYLDRNHDIVDETDVLIACPETIEEELRSGTWATVRYARKQGKPIVILEP